MEHVRASGGSVTECGARGEGGERERRVVISSGQD
jgi:hypothetical protein